MKGLAIDVRHLSKVYRLYNRPVDRIKESLHWRNKKYSQEFHALRDISFEVGKGETVGIIGTNGAGKSTLLKMITGVLTPSEGEMQINGKVSALLELGTGFNQEYTGVQNIYLNGRMMGYSKKEMDEKFNDIVEFADIDEFINQPVKTYSSGMFARLAFAVAINVEPDILIVDEALSVGDLFFQNKCYKKFEELKEKNVTILFVSHDIASVRQMCSKVLWIDKGYQKIFSESELVCSMYMDEKRYGMNQYMDTYEERLTVDLMEKYKVSCSRRYPYIQKKDKKFDCNDVEITSCFITNHSGEITVDLNVEKEYDTHVIFRANKCMQNIIVGFVFENNKGLPLFDINNYINQEQVINVERGRTVEVVFHFKLPRLMRGVYLMGVALSKGTQEKSATLTWIHSAIEVTINNPGYNSSYIEIPSNIEVFEMKTEDVSYF